MHTTCLRLDREPEAFRVLRACICDRGLVAYGDADALCGAEHLDELHGDFRVEQLVDFRELTDEDEEYLADWDAPEHRRLQLARAIDAMLESPATVAPAATSEAA